MSQVQNDEITTLEGLAQNGKLHPLQQAWIDEQVPQCGFCQNGQILTAKALLDKTAEPHRRANPRGHERHAVSLYDVLRHQRRHQTRRKGDGMRRRDFVKNTGLLVVGIAASDSLVAIWVKRIVVAHDCGLVINPEALIRVVEAGSLHGLSRALHEEVKFDAEKVTSVDWMTHPTLRHEDTPE